jgi:WhiB family redox-sensing transcriptional regulator
MPVAGMCLAYAITADERFGIWGGLDPEQRRSLRRRLQCRHMAGAATTRDTA